METLQYRQLLGRGRKAAEALAVELKRMEQRRPLEGQAPSRRVLLERLIQQIRADLADANRVLDYAHARVFHDQKLPSTEKVLSLADGSAAYIQKGNRNPVIGYKPQLVRSGNGFVASLIVPQGNAADCTELAPAIADSIRRTGVVAEWVSTDDGYASAKGRDELLGMGVKDISISGAKGKKLTTPDDWDSEEYRDARRNRSAVESLMFTIKDGFEFGELGRRGLEAVRDELLEKVLSYNGCRIVLMKKRRAPLLDLRPHLGVPIPPRPEHCRWAEDSFPGPGVVGECLPRPSLRSTLCPPSACRFSTVISTCLLL